MFERQRFVGGFYSSVDCACNNNYRIGNGRLYSGVLPYTRQRQPPSFFRSLESLDRISSGVLGGCTCSVHLHVLLHLQKVTTRLVELGGLRLSLFLSKNKPRSQYEIHLLLFRDRLYGLSGREATSLRRTQVVWQGVIRYSDRFPNTPEHVTKFCYRVQSYQKIDGGVSDPTVTQFQGHTNCVDEECSEK